jgi:hypothetical protein
VPSRNSTSGNRPPLPACSTRARASAAVSKIKPLIRNLMPRQKMLDPCALGDHFWPITRIPSNGGWVARQPIFEQIVDHGVKPLLRRIPRLYQIKANLHLSIQMARGFREQIKNRVSQNWPSDSGAFVYAWIVWPEAVSKWILPMALRREKLV